jgi:hypothetical protein
MMESYDILEKPYDDNFMAYNYAENRYVPLVDGITSDSYVNLVVDWGTKENAQSYLDLVSRVVYEVALSFKDQKYRLKEAYYLSHSKEARELLMRLFSDTVWYNRRDGGFMMAYNSGANLNQGKLIEFGIDKAISPIAMQLIKNSILGTKYFTIDINTKVIYDTLAELLVALVVGGYITQAESDVVTASELLSDLPYNEAYEAFLLDSGKYLFTDLETLAKAVLLMKKNNSTTGTW